MSPSTAAPRLAPTTYRPTPNQLLAATACPECAAPVVRQSGCATCPSCGWGKCG